MNASPLKNLGYGLDLNGTLHKYVLLGRSHFGLAFQIHAHDWELGDSLCRSHLQGTLGENPTYVAKCESARSETMPKLSIVYNKKASIIKR